MCHEEEQLIRKYIDFCHDYSNATLIPTSLRDKSVALYSSQGEAMGLLHSREPDAYLYNPYRNGPEFCSGHPNIQYGRIPVNDTNLDIYIGPIFPTGITEELFDHLMREQVISAEHREDLKEYIMQIAKLSNKLDELEISKAKLEFDKNNLVHQINDLKTQNETEMKLFSFYKSNEISQYQKTISSLQSTINELNNVNIPTIEITSTQTNLSNSNLLLDQISSLENQITKLNEDNFTLLKQNQSLKSEIEEKNIKLNHKENIITSLQKELNNSIEEFKFKLNEAQVNSEENFNQNKETQSQLEQLILERDELIRKNEELKKEYLQFNKSINEASQAFAEKCEKFQSAIGEYKTKIKNYKEKIHNLKAKVNELIEEINRLKQDNKTVCEVLENIDNTALNNYKSDNNLLNNKNDIRRKSGTHSYAYSPSGNNEIHSIYKKDDIYSPLITNISGKPKPMLSTSYFMRDPLEENQKKALEDYKRVLTKVDFNLKQFTTNNKYMDYN